MNPNYMISRDSIVFIWRAHLRLIFQNILCIICYKSINVKSLLRGLDTQNHRDFRTIGVVYIVMRDQMSYMPWRGLGTPKVFLGSLVEIVLSYCPHYAMHYHDLKLTH